MTSVKIISRNIDMTVETMKKYKNNINVRRPNRAANIRFGKIGFTCDADVDG